MFINQFLARFQKTKLASILKDSLFFNNIDKILFTLLIATIISTTFMPTGVIGLLAIVFALGCFFRVIVKTGETAELSFINKILIFYLLVVIISLMGSSYFILSLKGILKTFVYIAFYFASVYFLSENRKKIIPLVFLITGIMGVESVIAIMQNVSHIEAIATWQDTSNVVDPTHVISRAYGTLLPYNPNLLAGYLITGISYIFAFIGIAAFNKDKKLILTGVSVFLLTFLAIFATGCRGAYLGLFAFIFALFAAVLFLLKKKFGSFKQIKTKYKLMLFGFVAFLMGIVLFVPSITERILSIFTLRKDSSISFRMNVYEACYQMFLDNKFLGIGVGNKNFREIYGLYMKTGFDALGAYSVPLEIAVESGIFAFISFFAFLLAIIYRIIKYLNFKGAHPVHKILVFSTLLIIISTMAHGLFDTVFFRPQIQILFWLNLAIFHSIVIKRGRLKKARLEGKTIFNFIEKFRKKLNF